VFRAMVLEGVLGKMEVSKKLRKSNHRVGIVKQGEVCLIDKMHRKFAILLLAASSSFATVYEEFEYNVNVSGNQITITRYTGTNSQILVPNEISGIPVTTLAGEDSDPYSNNVVLYLKFDSLPLMDSSDKAASLIPAGDTTINSNNPKYGSASVYFDGVGDTLDVPHQNFFNFESGEDFTIESWINYSDVSGHPPIISKGSQATSSGWTLYYDNEFKLIRFGVPHISNDIGASFDPSTNKWYHIACTRRQGTLKLFIDGKLSATENESNYAYSTSENVKIGISHSGYMLHGYLDEVKITKGVSRYSTDFIPFRGAFPNLEKIDSITIPMTVGYICNTFFGMQEINELIFLGNAPNLQAGVHFTSSLSNLLFLPGKTGFIPLLGGKTSQEITASQILSSPSKVSLFTSSQVSEKKQEGIAFGVSLVTNNPNLYQLYRTNQIMDMRFGGMVLNFSTNGQIFLNYRILQSPDLKNWSTYQQYELPITNAPPEKMFLRIHPVGQ